MALVQYGFRVTAQLLGEKSGTRSKVWELERDSGAATDDEAMATARAQTVAMIAAFKVTSGAEVTSYDLVTVYREDGAIAVPADADLYTEALLTCGLDTAQIKKGSHTIPAPANGIFVGDDETTKQIDATDPNLLTYLAFFAAPNFFRISDGEQILSTPKIVASRIRSVSSGKSF